MSARRHVQGFSLIELLISSAIMAAVVVLLMQTFTTQNQTYIVVDQTTEAQQNARVIAELMEHDVRVAGFLVPKSAAVCGVDRTNAPDTLYVSNSEVIRTVDQLETAGKKDLISGDLGAQVTTVAGATLGPGTVSLSVNQNYLDIAADGADFVVNGGAILVDANDTNGRVACGKVTNVTATVITVTLENAIGPLQLNRKMLLVPAYVYEIVPGVAGAPSTLRRNNVVLADDVEDLQLAIFADANNDRNIDPGEYLGEAGAAAYLPTATDGDSIREVRLDVVVRTRTQDPNQKFDRGRHQTPENRVLTAAETAFDAAQPGYRRRVHQAVVRLRNVGRG
jgi:prepilin-type N-terminal cleavage/methylation domain-containing protein